MLKARTRRAQSAGVQEGETGWKDRNVLSPIWSRSALFHRKARETGPLLGPSVKLLPVERSSFPAPAEIALFLLSSSLFIPLSPSGPYDAKSGFRSL